VSKQAFDGFETGKWLVRTKHSEYVFDFDANEVTRIAGKDAAKWHDEDVTYPLSQMSPEVEVDWSMTVYVDHPDKWIRSTVVKSIERVVDGDAS
jgi:hypothetical protein